MSIRIADVDTLSQNWWAVLLRGVAAVIFGIVTFLAPGISLTALVLVFGAYALVDGIFSIASAIRRRGATDNWWLLLLHGLLGVVVGVATLVWPGITAVVLLYLIAFWALMTGVFEIAAAIRLRKVITNEWWLGLSGVLAIVFGVLLTLAPGPGALAMVIWIGAYAFVYGVFLVLLGLRLRRRLRRA